MGRRGWQVCDDGMNMIKYICNEISNTDKDSKICFLDNLLSFLTTYRGLEKIVSMLRNTERCRETHL